MIKLTAGSMQPFLSLHEGYITMRMYFIILMLKFSFPPLFFSSEVEKVGGNYKN